MAHRALQVFGNLEHRVGAGRDKHLFCLYENQYFISSVDRSTPQNRIAEAIFQRSVKTLLKRVKSELKKHVIGHPARAHQVVSDYIQFFSLRNHAMTNGKVFTEQVYVHSKVMIVDDRKVLIGSANINDRSMLGVRDSEIAAFIQQSSHRLIESTLNGEDTPVSPFVFDLRRELWSRFLGVPPDHKHLVDPLSPGCAKLFSIADSNTKAYLDVFGYLPNNIVKFKQISKSKEIEVDVHEYQKFMPLMVKGLIVNFAVDFLKEEKLGRSMFSPEFLLSKAIYI